MKKWILFIFIFIMMVSPRLVSADENYESYKNALKKYYTLEVVQALIKNGLDANTEIKEGYTILHGATDLGNLDIVKYLVDNGAVIETKSNEGNTALMLAVGNGNLKVVKYLIDKGADVNEKNDLGSTVLMLASRGG
ncbi:hypothetical protein LCGC14_3113250, partial [marine sediment metagenome]